MIRLFQHITLSKDFLQEAVNCWLTYIASQPVNIDMQIVLLFLLQYFGILQAILFFKSARCTFSSWFNKEQQMLEAMTDESSENLMMS
jgi:hypothetical protein